MRRYLPLALTIIGVLIVIAFLAQKKTPNQVTGVFLNRMETPTPSQINLAPTQEEIDQCKAGLKAQAQSEIEEANDTLSHLDSYCAQ